MKIYYILALISIFLLFSCAKPQSVNLAQEKNVELIRKEKTFISDPLFFSVCVTDSLESRPIIGLTIKLTEQLSGTPLLAGRTDSIGCLIFNLDPKRYNLERMAQLKIAGQGFDKGYKTFYTYKEEFIDINGKDSVFLVLKLNK